MTTVGHYLGQLLIRLRIEDSQSASPGDIGHRIKGARGVQWKKDARYGVYFIQQGKGGPIKIGISTNPHKRLVALQIGSPVQLKLLAVMNTNHPGTEHLLHRRFSHLRMAGEWFEPEQELLEYISEIVKGEKE